jgi:prophage regulatory protein
LLKRAAGTSLKARSFAVTEENQLVIAPKSEQNINPATAPGAIDEEFWSLKIVMAKTGLSRATVYDYVAHGYFPRQRRIGPGRVAWFASDIRAWMESRPASGKTGD